MGILAVGFVVVLVTLLAIKAWYQSTMRMCRSTRRMDGKVVVVTGANTGIGKETARDLARRGARVYLACRDLTRGSSARMEIIESTGNKNVEVLKLDLGSLASVRDFVKELKSRETRLDVLVNNAAATGLENKLSRDGMQQEMQINHFGPFLLTVLLIDVLKKSSPSRVVTVSSMAHKFGKIELDNLNCEKSFPGGGKLYCHAKLANVLFANELARRLDGTGVSSNSLHPGVVKTEIGRRLPSFVKHIFGFLIGFAFKNANEGAQTTIHLAVSEEVGGVTGRYFVDCKDAKMSSDAQNHELAKKLWEKCVQLVKLAPEEISLL
ncbi:retinol dehydrogenase 11-like [Neocloeon triangulifer]|uniref:retinol dehydrogenase 11-like n=1 Tax=Neocloeon triangulifer TaxID=2078957 RepID=UPI00286EC165|nr:retinol dehydrogenase 11-like [Neocloeon triangulifer]